MTNSLVYSVITGSLGSDSGGATVSFTASAFLFDSIDSLTIPPVPIVVTCDFNGNFTTESEDGNLGLLCTDNADIPQSFYWTMEVFGEGIDGNEIPPQAWTFQLPQVAGSPIDISDLTLTPVM